MTTVWNFPTRVLFGEGAIADAGAEVERVGGKHALLVTDPGVADAGLAEQVGKSLKRSKIAYSVFSGISSNPTEKEALAASQAFAGANADVVVAVGGGSVLDVGKLVRLLASHAPPLAQYDDAKDGADRIVAEMPKMVAVPTTAGTGSEVGRASVVTLAATGRKTVIFAPKLLPDVAILDPALTTGLPAGITAATGFDALTHCIEAYCVAMDHPMADAIALTGIALVAEHLLTAVESGADVAARGAMLKASMFGAVAFQKGLGACHSLSHPLSAEKGLHHGLANSLCLPAVLDFNRGAIPEKIARVARTLGVRDDTVETLAFECSGAVRALRKRVGLPAGLGEAGVQEEVLAKLAPLAAEDGCHRDNPRPCSKDDMLALYRASM